MRQSHRMLLWLSVAWPAMFSVAAGQSQPNTTLQVGTTVERTLGARQSHSYTINLEQDQFMQLVVDQHGIDVVVRVFSPVGKRLGEFDSPNGDEGPENVTVVAVEAGAYRIEVAPLSQDANEIPGRYEIKITELRKATEQELQAGNEQNQLKAKARALITQAIESFPDVHRPDTRARFQIKAAQFLWDSDQKRAGKLFEQAIASVKEFMAGIENSEREYYEAFQTAQQLRMDLVNAVTPNNPDLALDFLHSTRGLQNPYGNAADQARREQQMEVSLVARIAASDPRRSFQMAEDSLKNGASTSLVEVLNNLRPKDAELASRLAHDIAAKLENERFFNNPEAGYLALSFLQMARSRNPARANNGDAPATVNLMSDDEFRNLFQKLVSEVLAFDPPRNGSYSPERNLAQNIINTLKRMNTDLQTYAADKKAALDAKLAAVQTTGDPQRDNWTKYQTAINEGPADTALESIGQAPAEMRDSLYQQLANKVTQSGDNDGARQIITEHLSNPVQRQQALREIDRQAIFAAVNKGKVDEAIRILTGIRPADRAAIIVEIATRFGPGLKRSAALGYLEQLAAMLDVSGKAPDQTRMQARLQMAQAFARYDVGRSFDLIDPLLDQFNELADAATTLNGFGQKYYQDGEVIMNGNPIADIVNRLAQSLASLGLMNFDRAKTGADRLKAVDVRLLVYFMMAQSALQDTRSGVYDLWH
ncbi:MAG TPA: hypothetical protein VKD91_06905 [Pyrinomonadaceae bacterium]|nr:hypothetical protein [Pyrinomonadaceae bacterium]